jgi:hypothetical protein
VPNAITFPYRPFSCRGFGRGLRSHLQNSSGNPYEDSCVCPSFPLISASTTQHYEVCNEGRLCSFADTASSTIPRVAKTSHRRRRTLGLSAAASETARCMVLINPLVLQRTCLCPFKTVALHLRDIAPGLDLSLSIGCI